MMCNKCKIDKENGDFYENKKNISGLAGICKSCTVKVSSKDRITIEDIPISEAKRRYAKLDVNSPTYFTEKAKLRAIIYNYEDTGSTLRNVYN